MQDLKDKVVLVSGAGSGIGAALAREAAGRGAKVAVTDVRADAVGPVRDEVVRDGGSAIALTLDVSSPQSWGAAADQVERELGPIDLLCSNAGVGPSPQTVLEMPVDYLRWVFDINFFGGFHGAQCVAPRMVDRREGHILVTASVAGFAAGGMMLGYNASKHALVALGEALRAELGGTGVSVSVLCPAAVATGLMRSTNEVIPETLARTLPELPAEPQEARIAALAASAGGVMSPDEVARRAIDGVLGGDFYIFTHLESRAMTLARTEEVKTVFDELAAREPASR
jgi:NAD(P)-dependent dehydrogenase (short-subunit alcohol dehydrogenase family)